MAMWASMCKRTFSRNLEMLSISYFDLEKFLQCLMSSLQHKVIVFRTCRAIMKIIAKVCLSSCDLCACE